ncbi:MAG TPA: RluA family pseudouridine synthase [Candidatus Coprocola pullicola]|mgnify:FL=1|nr:RluA family pseudouridine synthase [Candidatus Coprocola pullicola]
MQPMILYEDSFLLCVIKPSGMPAQPDKTGDMDILTFLQQKEKSNAIGLIHRLDRPVGGVMLFAKTKEAEGILSQMVQKKQIKKEYFAVVCGKANEKEKLEDYLLKNGRTNLSSVVDKNTKGAKKAVLSYDRKEVLEEGDCFLSLLKIELETGRHHQIRVQLSQRGLPIWGDQKYNTIQKMKKGTKIALWSYSLTFLHPKTGEILFIKAIPEGEPFSKFTNFM